MADMGFAGELASTAAKSLAGFDSEVSTAASALAAAMARQGQADDVRTDAPTTTDPATTGGPSTSTTSGDSATTSQTPAGDQSTAAPTPGSATVVGAAADSEYAFDSSFTPALVAGLQNNPDMSLDEVLQNLSAGSLIAPGGSGGSNDNSLHHPTIVQYGQTDENTSESRDNKKIAVLVGNQNYQNPADNLGTPIAEANSMSSALASRGYDANVHPDQTRAQMSTLWSSMVGASTEGDDLVAFYGGPRRARRPRRGKLRYLHQRPGRRGGQLGDGQGGPHPLRDGQLSLGPRGPSGAHRAPERGRTRRSCTRLR